MTEARPSAPPFASALIVAANEGHARIDREFLKQARIPHLRFATSGAAGMAVLRRREADLVLCDAELDDMAGAAFVSTLRADPELAGYPVIMTALSPDKADVLRAVSLGVAGFLLRPYSQKAFRSHLTMAARLAAFDAAERAALARARMAELSGDDAAALTQFSSVASGPDAAPKLFEEGMVALASKDLNRAIAAFHRALSVNALFVEAYLGLARAWDAKGSRSKYRYFMKQAASACARARRFAELRDRFVELLAKDEAGFNPFLALGNDLLQDRHYTAAVAVFQQAQTLTPQNVDISIGLAKAYHFLRQPERALAAVDKALNQNDRSPDAQTMYQRLTGRRFDDIPPIEEMETSTDAPQYPWLLRGVLYVAGWAADGMFRLRRTAQAA